MNAWNSLTHIYVWTVSSKDILLHQTNSGSQLGLIFQYTWPYMLLGDRSATFNLSDCDLYQALSLSSLAYQVIWCLYSDLVHTSLVCWNSTKMTDWFRIITEQEIYLCDCGHVSGSTCHQFSLQFASYLFTRSGQSLTKLKSRMLRVRTW